MTGASGFVGGHLVEALRQIGAEPRALVRSSSQVALLDSLGVEQVLGSFEDVSSLERAVTGVDVVLHLAAATRARTEQEYRAANVDAPRALIEAMRRARPRPRRLVYMSSMAAAGPSQAGRPVAESDPPRPITVYGRSKLAGEQLVLEADDAFDVGVIRAPAVYGPRDRDLLIYFRLVQGGLLPLPAGPDRWIQLVHVADLARALVAAARAAEVSGVYQVAEPRAYRWAEVAGMIERVLRRRALRLSVPRWSVWMGAALVEASAAMVGRASIFNRDKVRELLAAGWLCETERARRELDWTPRWELEEGLRDTVRWYREHGYLRGAEEAL